MKIRFRYKSFFIQNHRHTYSDTYASKQHSWCWTLMGKWVKKHPRSKLWLSAIDFYSKFVHCTYAIWVRCRYVCFLVPLEKAAKVTLLYDFCVNVCPVLLMNVLLPINIVYNIEKEIESSLEFTNSDSPLNTVLNFTKNFNESRFQE